MLFANIRTMLTAAVAACYMADEGASETLLDLESINDIDLSTVEDVPEFVEPPNGVYQLGLKAKIEGYKNKEGEANTRIRHIYEIQKVIELADKTELEPTEGSLFSETFVANGEGLKYWKAKAKSILGDLGNSKVSEVLNELNSGVSFRATTKLKKTADKNDKTKEFTNVQIRVVSQE